MFIVLLFHASYLHATPQDLLLYGDQCAICRDKMKEATKLPCGHCFHLSCLHSWIHHRPFQATCPTCRSTIGSSPSLDNTSAEAAVT
jgi:Ring finger domain